MDRARSGTNRMHAILTALSEATRVEQSIDNTDRVHFDLSELVRNMGQAYRQTFAQHRIETLLPNETCMIDGSPDLIAQLLDKLMDNAADFTPVGKQITLALEAGPREYRLSVSNEGPPLPAAAERPAVRVAGQQSRQLGWTNPISGWASTSCA